MRVNNANRHMGKSTEYPRLQLERTKYNGTRREDKKRKHKKSGGLQMCKGRRVGAQNVREGGRAKCARKRARCTAAAAAANCARGTTLGEANEQRSGCERAKEGQRAKWQNIDSSPQRLIMKVNVSVAQQHSIKDVECAVKMRSKHT